MAQLITNELLLLELSSQHNCLFKYQIHHIKLCIHVNTIFYIFVPKTL